MMTSPGSSSGVSSAITASTGAPALTIRMIWRGRSSEATKSSMVSAPCTPAAVPCSAMNSSVRAAVRL